MFLNESQLRQAIRGAEYRERVANLRRRGVNLRLLWDLETVYDFGLLEQIERATDEEIRELNRAWLERSAA